MEGHSPNRVRRSPTTTRRFGSFSDFGAVLSDVALPPIADIDDPRVNVRFVPIVLQNSQNAGRLIFRGKTKQATIADQCSLKPASGIACEFGARRRSPPHNYSIVAPTAQRI
jgi:hypothetical protein